MEVFAFVGLFRGTFLLIFHSHNMVIGWGGGGGGGGAQVICYLHLLKTPTMSIGRESERE